MSKKSREDLGEYVRRVMKLKGLTQRDVQQMSEGRITDGYVASIITARAQNLSVEKLQALAMGLGVDVNELFNVACGHEMKPDSRPRLHRRNTDSLMLLELLQKMMASPEVTEILDEIVMMSPFERAVVLKTIRRLNEVA